MKRSMTEVIFGLLEHATDPFLFDDIVVQFLDVPFCLFSTFVFQFGSPPFSFLRGARRRLYFAQIAIVTEIDNCQQGDNPDECVQASCADTAHNNSRTGSTREIGNRHPEEIPAPHLPDRLVVLEGIRDRSNTSMR